MAYSLTLPAVHTHPATLCSTHRQSPTTTLANCTRHVPFTVAIAKVRTLKINAIMHGSIFKGAMFLLLMLLQSVTGDVSISQPLTGQTFEVSGSSASVQITWIESNAVPLLTDITSYTFVLCSGSNSNITAVKTLAKSISASDITGYSYDLSISASSGADGSYYVQIYAAASDGYTIHYSNRFNLGGMTGSFVPSVGVNLLPPDAQTSLTGGTNTPLSIDSRSFTVPYYLQTGRTRYAPMQLQPGTHVTQTTWTRQFPTSAVTYFSVPMSTLAQLSTLTPGWSYTLTSAVNWASPAPQPSENGGWYAASARLTKPQLSKAISGLTTTTQ